jgi:hypothetical protein
VDIDGCWTKVCRTLHTRRCTRRGKGLFVLENTNYGKLPKASKGGALSGSHHVAGVGVGSPAWRTRKDLNKSVSKGKHVEMAPRVGLEE